MIDLYSSLKCTLEQQICKFGCKETYFNCIGKNAAPLKADRITLINMWRMFDGTLTDSQVSILWCYYEKHFGALTVTVKKKSSMGTANNPGPPQGAFQLTDTGSEVYLPLNCGTLEEAFIMGSADSTYFDILSQPFLDNVKSLRLFAIKDLGTPVNHYCVRYDGDRIDAPAPTANAGWNCTECCNTATNCCVNYTSDLSSSFATYAIKFCNEIGAQIIMGCNINNFSLPAYIDSMTYIDSQCGLFGVQFMEEYPEPYCECTLCGDFAAITAAATTLANGVAATLPSVFRTADWKGLQNGGALENSYTDLVQTIPTVTDYRIYCSEINLIPNAELVSGRTEEQYKQSIDTAVDSRMPYVISGIKTATGKPVSITNNYSNNTTPFAGTWLQSYYAIRARVKQMLIEAQTPGSINWAALGRFSYIRARNPTMTFVGQAIAMCAPIYTSANHVYTCDTGMGTYSVASADPATGSGCMIVINPTENEIASSNVAVGLSSKSIISINSIYSTSLTGTPVKAITSNIPAYSISFITF